LLCLVIGQGQAQPLRRSNDDTAPCHW